MLQVNVVEMSSTKKGKKNLHTCNKRQRSRKQICMSSAKTVHSCTHQLSRYLQVNDFKVQLQKLKLFNIYKFLPFLIALDFFSHMLNLLIDIDFKHNNTGSELSKLWVGTWDGSSLMDATASNEVQARNDCVSFV